MKAIAAKTTQPRAASEVRTSRTPTRGAAPIALLVSLCALTACGPSGPDEGAVLRGDNAWANGDFEEALAEYRLANRQGSDKPEILARIAHAYTALRRIDETRIYYARAIAGEPEYESQAVSDLIHLARLANERGDLFGVASAVQGAMEFRPGINIQELSLPLARHHAQNGEYGRALPFYQRALAVLETDSTTAAEADAGVVFEAALAHEEIGDCVRALVFFEQYRATRRRWLRGEVNWHVGNCSYQLGLEFRGVALEAVGEAARDDAEAEALRLLGETIRVGVPRNLQSGAHFEKGEILAAQGRCEEAVEAFRQVRLADPAGTGPLVTRAQERIDEIRFGPKRPREATPREVGFGRSGQARLRGRQDVETPVSTRTPC